MDIEKPSRRYPPLAYRRVDSFISNPIGWRNVRAGAKTGRKASPGAVHRNERNNPGRWYRTLFDASCWNIVPGRTACAGLPSASCSLEFFTHGTYKRFITVDHRTVCRYSRSDHSARNSLSDHWDG